MRVGRIVRTADFERVLARRPCVRSTHFALHHLAAGPSLPAPRAPRPAEGSTCTQLSTSRSPSWSQPVDDSLAGDAPEIPPPGRWLGLVCPKRHARRAVTRNLLKRQTRALMDELGSALPLGLWVMRLRAPFDPRQFPSATSDALRTAARNELRGLIVRAASDGAAMAAPAR